jgi:fatty-acid desaturase
MQPSGFLYRWSVLQGEILEPPQATPMSPQVLFSIFHLSFSIFHLSFVIGALCHRAGTRDFVDVK